ncbi:MAG TPA: hypothetical protein VI298_03545 [Geobacteraceae bacterium]
MNLHEVIESIESFPEDATIFAERINGAFLPESEVELFELSDEEMTKPIKEVAAIRTPGKDYFLEVFVAKEAIEGWQDYRGGNEVSASELTDVVIFYAENDAWPMTDEG